ncbi:MAG: metallophosphoesterase [Clostridia bacterium]|nr:metallophosphoesterase [Clostridia bacterium]
MSFGKTAVFIAKIIAAWALLCACQVCLRKGRHPVLRTAVFLIKLLLIPAAAIMFVAVTGAFSYRHGDILAAVYVALVGDTAASAAEYLIRRLKHIKDRTAGRLPCIKKLNCVLSLLFCVCFAVFGIVNAGRVVKRTHVWQADGLTREHTFVFMADIHAGNAQSLETLEKVCAQINDVSPEFVILGGDVTDEMTSREDMTAAYRILSGIEAPVYFVYGNHDRQPDADLLGGRTYSDSELEAALRGAGIRVLSDEFVKVADDLVLLGREDVSMGGARKPWSQLSDPYGGVGALLVADHQPYDEEQLAEEVSALQLSGHTLAGQLWPLRFVYLMLGLPAYGEFEEAGTRLYVTAGESGWMLPLRTQARCEWELITLRP